MLEFLSFQGVGGCLLEVVDVTSWAAWNCFGWIQRKICPTHCCMTSKEKNLYITRPNDGSVIFHRIILLLVSQATLKVSNNKKMWSSWQKYINGTTSIDCFLIFDSVVFDKMLPHKLSEEQSQCHLNVCKTLANFYIFGIFCQICHFRQNWHSPKENIHQTYASCLLCRIRHFCQNRLYWRGLFQHLIRSFATSLAKFCHILHFCQIATIEGAPFNISLDGFCQNFGEFSFAIFVKIVTCQEAPLPSYLT